MNKKLFLYTAAGFFFTSAAGIFLHFAYDISGQNPLVGMFAPVNESTWEHMKLVFFPSFLYGLLGWPFFRKAFPSFFTSCLMGTLTGTAAVAVIFYTYSGILGRDSFPLDILTFLLAVLLDYYLSYQMSLQPSNSSLSAALALFLCITLMVCFFLFSYTPPELGLFSNPESKNIE